MNRAVAVALILACLPMAAFAQSTPAPTPGASGAPTPAASVDPALQKRIDSYQEHRLIFEPANGSYALRQGPDPIYDADFVELINDPSLTRFWQGERNKDFALWIGSGVVGLPAGALLFYQNFFGQGTLAPFGGANRPASQAAGDPRAFALSVVGLGLASYAVYNLSNWVLEQLDLRHPTRLDADSITPRVHDFNETLRDRLALDPEDIPPPPTPRPSVSPSGAPSGAPTAAGSTPPNQNFPLPAPQIRNLPDYPTGDSPGILMRPQITPSEPPPTGTGPGQPLPSGVNFDQTPAPAPSAAIGRPGTR